MFRHNIAQYTSLVNSTGRPSDIEAPGVPENLVGKNLLTEVGSKLLWDAPSSGGTVFYYEVFVNNSFWANSRGTEKNYPNSQVGDVFKVRAVGVLGLKSGFSNTWTYEGSESLIPTVTGYAESLHLEWNDISGSDQVNFEGYNVYFEGVKQNSALLNGDVNGYPFWNLGAGNTHTLAVSFEYDGGQESALFEVDGTVGGKGLLFQAVITSGYRSYPLVGRSGRIFDREGGVIVKENTQMRVTPLFKASLQYDHPKWSTVDTYTRTYLLVGYNGARMRFNAGCDNKSNILESNTFKQITVNTDKDSQLYGRIYHGWNFRITGSQCDPTLAQRENVSFLIAVSGDKFLRIGEYSNNSYKVFQLPKDDESRLDTNTNEVGKVYFTWAVYQSVPYIKIYIKPVADTNYPANSYHDGFLGYKENFYEVNDLAVGDYNAKLEYYLGDQSTLMLTTDEVTFTID